MFRKTIYRKNKKLTLAIDIEPLSDTKFKITNFYHSKDGNSFIPHQEVFENNDCIFILA